MSEDAGSDQTATKRTARSKAAAGRPGNQRRSAATAVPTLDDETRAALILYNTYLVADRERQAHERALKKAEKAKDEAAAAVRKLNERRAPAAEIAEAEAGYRAAAEALRHLGDGHAAPPRDSDDETDGDPGAHERGPDDEKDPPGRSSASVTD